MGGSEAKDQTSCVDCGMDQVKEGGWTSSTGERPERCFRGTILDNLLEQESMRKEGKREVQDDHSLNWHPDFRGAVKQNQQDSLRAWR